MSAMSNKPKARTRIKLLRQRLGITQQKLAEMLGVSWVTVARWEMKVGSSPSKLALEKIVALEKKR